MKAAFAILLWFAIGAGVQGAFLANHNKSFPPGTPDGAWIIGAFLWPAYVAGDIYRAVGPKSAPKGGDA